LIVREITLAYHMELYQWDASTDQKLQVAQLSQRDRSAAWVSFGQKWKTGTQKQYFADIIGLS